MAENDVEILRERLAAADDGHPDGLVSIEFRARTLDREAAIARASDIAGKASKHRALLEELDDEARMLTEERDRLRTELTDLEREYRAFQAEAAGLEREIESVQRREKLVAILERKKKDRDDLFRDRASALGNLKDKIERRRIELDHRIRAARARPVADEYEARARLKLDAAGD
jgi:chromosome segregation ATPase